MKNSFLLLLVCINLTLFAQWSKMPGGGKDISVGADGSVWLTGGTKVGNADDYSIFKWNGSNWSQVDGGAVAIAVCKNGIPYVINSKGEIYHK